MNNVLYILAGPTASGKTSVSLPLAQKLNAEIISADSMAIYRQMNIGTAKPGDKERQLIPHHLIDICNPWQTFSLQIFLEKAKEAIEEIFARNKQVLIVAGTPLYIKGLIEGIFEGPSANWELREQLATRSLNDLYGELQKVDPTAAAKISSSDERRIIRALEVYLITGIPISVQQKEQTKPYVNYQSCIVGLLWSRPCLYERIELRVDKMLASGLIEETKTLLALSQPLSHTAQQAIGYREVIQHLNGEVDISELSELIKRNTRHFAKRQMTWWRRFPIQWLELNENTIQQKIVDRAINFFYNTSAKNSELYYDTNCSDEI